MEGQRLGSPLRREIYVNRPRKLAGIAVFTLVAAALIPAGSAQAYCAAPTLAWNSATLSIRSAASVPQSWDTTMAAAARQWSGIPGADWTVAWKNYSFVGPVMARVLKQATAPPGFGGGPAVTDLRYTGSTITAGNIYLSTGFTWYTDGSMNQADRLVDVQTIMIHELGHEVYLNHPSSCGSMTSAEVYAAMNPNWKQKWYTSADDEAGAAARK